MVYIKLMGNIKLCLLVVLALILAVSCGSGPKTDAQQEITKEEETAANDTEKTFDPGNISQEYYVSTKENVQNFIEELNKIISGENYNAWRQLLSSEYFAEISSQENLQTLSELPAMKTRKIVLRTAEDYFKHVVVPSRANSRVDDIEFINEKRVKAFTININRAGEEQRLLLYNLEKTNDLWKIVN